jgi:cellulose synthase/poly-beta-1,6-N-acetylglucosamine synthase-like glycosyltransferase
MIWDLIVAIMAGFLESIQYEIHHRSTMDWILFFFPVLILFEIPRYYFPLFGLLIVNPLGTREKNRTREDSFVQKSPRVSVVLAARNEEPTLGAAIHSLLDQDYPNLEIIVVDDSSDDRTYEIANRFARRGLIRLIRNTANRGRSGRPSASNLGMRLANGEFIVSVDADCTFDRNLIRHLIAPFSDPRVGLVAGNVVVRNQTTNLLTRLQTLEYAVSIDMRKRWTDLFGCTLQASGALGAFRRSALIDVGGWDPDLAEDGDVSLRIIKAGWKVRFSPKAVALTEVPETLSQLMKQRNRWDRGTLRTYFVKHGRLLKPSTAGWAYAIEMWSQLAFFLIATLAYPLFLAWILTHGVALFTIVMTVSFLAYGVLSLSTLIPLILIVDRLDHSWSLLVTALASPMYKEFFRWVRFKAILWEYLRLDLQYPGYLSFETCSETAGTRGKLIWEGWFVFRYTVTVGEGFNSSVNALSLSANVIVIRRR